MFTICVKCKHHHGYGVWYGHYCHATERERVTDPVTGKQCFKGTNDLGGVYFTDERYPNCKTINLDGDCMLYDGPK